MTLLVSHPPGYTAERVYAFDVVLRTMLGLEYVAREQRRTDVAISAEGMPGLLRLADVLFATPAEDWLTAAALPPMPLARDGDLPVLYAAARAPHLQADEEWLGADVFGSSFFLLTRYEEIVDPVRDEHGRFPSAASITVREGFSMRAIVHDYAELLWARLRAVWPRLSRPARAPALRLSHDVDWPEMPARTPAAVARTVGGDLIRRRDPLLAGDRVRWELARRRGRLAEDPFDTFDELMDLSEAAGIRSAFYFLADNTYPMESVAHIMRRVHERGHEVGLHPGYGSFRDPEAIASQFATLAQACSRLGIEQPEWGGRQHYLQWENPVTWRAWESAGLAYDSTLGWADRGGFRTGACIDHPTFDLRASRSLHLRERPLVAMEAAVLSAGDAEETFALLRAECARVGGDFTLLWHNSHLLSRRDRDLYRGLVLS